jgi:serine/threonine-protein kinase
VRAAVPSVEPAGVEMPPFAVLPEPSDPTRELPAGPVPAPAVSSYPPPPPLPGASSSLQPLPAPPLPSAPPPPPASGGLNYNDDDDVTQIFDRGSSDSMPPPGLPPATAGNVPLPSFAPPATPSVLTFSDPVPSPDRKFYQRPGFLGALAAAVVIGAVAILLWPSSGRLVVAVAGPNGTVVDGITISVDDKVVCTGSPCQLDDLEPRSYLVAVMAEGFERTAPQAVVVHAGEDAVHNVTLQAPIVVAPTGIDIPASGPGLTVNVDGKALGSLPQKVLTPGEHVVRVSGGERYRDEEKTVSVNEGQVLSLQPFELEVKQGRATIEAGANASEATVKLDGKQIRLPYTTDLDATQAHKLVATREGFEDFEQELTFERGKAERTFEVALKPSEEEQEAEEQEPERAVVASSHRSSGSSHHARARSSSSSGKGTLNITSSPSAMVILDGRPIGKTPKTGIKVSPGAHSIVFVSGKGRKRATTKVAAGGSKTVSVRF